MIQPLASFAAPALLPRTLARLAAIALGLAGSGQDAGAWGSGHVDWQRQLLEVLPPDLLERASPEAAERSIREWSKFIDSFETFETEAGLIGPAGLARLERHAIRRRYDLHGEAARAAAFLLLADSLREERFDAALFWIASLGHSAADMSACNHDPLVHLATYDWTALDAVLPGGAPLRRAIAALDLSHAGGHPEGRAAFAAAVERMRLRDDGRGPEEALLEIMRYGQEGAAFLAARGPAVFAAAVAWSESDVPETRAPLFNLLAELGAWPLVRVARDVEVALRLAASPHPMPDLDEALLAAHAEQMARHVRSRRLEDEALYAEILRPLPAPGDPPVTGVVIEPTWRMNEGMFGFSDRTLAVALCRALESSGSAWATLDLRLLASQAPPSPGEMPRLLVAARQIHNYHGLNRADLEKHLAAYREAGGQILWIGGNTPPLAAPLLSRSLIAAEEGQWPVPQEQMQGSRLAFAGATAEWTLLRDPYTPAGWHRPYGKLRVEPASEAVNALLELRSGGQAITVGALESPAGRGAMAWLPTYALHPWLLAAPGTLRDPWRLRLDPAGEEILRLALQAMDRAASGRD